SGRHLLLAHLVFSPLVFWCDGIEPFAGVKNALLEAVAICLTGLGALAALCRIRVSGLADFVQHARQSLHRILTQPLTLGVVLYLFSATVSIFTSISTHTSLYGAHLSFGGMRSVVAYVVLFFGTRWLFPTVDSTRFLLGAAVAATAATAVYAVAQ